MMVVALTEAATTAGVSHAGVLSLASNTCANITTSRLHTAARAELNSAQFLIQTTDGTNDARTRARIKFNEKIPLQQRMPFELYVV